MVCVYVCVCVCVCECVCVYVCVCVCVCESNWGACVKKLLIRIFFSPTPRTGVLIKPSHHFWNGMKPTHLI